PQPDPQPTTIPTQSPPQWRQDAYLKAPNAGSGDEFGNTVALLGNTLAVGAEHESSSQNAITTNPLNTLDNSAPNSGGVYVFLRNGDLWSTDAFIKAVNAEEDDFFGHDLALSENSLAVGTYSESSNQTFISNSATASADNSAFNSGTVYVYRRSASGWAQEAYIKASNNGQNDNFGYAVALSGDTLAVGACNEDSSYITNIMSSNETLTESGAVYIYKRSGTTWALESFLKALNASVNDFFGDTLSLSGDTLAVGVSNEDSSQTTITNGPTAASNDNAPESGATYIFKRTTTNWSQEAYIKAGNAEGDDYFGWSVALSGDALAVGATGESSLRNTIRNDSDADSNNSSAQSGAVYLYRRNNSQWVQEAFIKASNANSTDEFGTALSLSGDVLAVGASNEDSNQTTVTNGNLASINNEAQESGAAYLFRRIQNSENSAWLWVQEAYIKAHNAESADAFGSALALDGDTVSISATRESSSQSTITNGAGGGTDNSAPASGAVYIFRKW
ncbi:MAG: putative signal peptide protein, partial [Pseudomonadota bacterium]